MAEHKYVKPETISVTVSILPDIYSCATGIGNHKSYCSAVYFFAESLQFINQRMHT
jgi:hypothetical protein